MHVLDVLGLFVQTMTRPVKSRDPLPSQTLFMKIRATHERARRKEVRAL